MQACDVVFFRGKGIVGSLISWFTQSPYSHVGLAIDGAHIIQAYRFVQTGIVPFEYDPSIHRVYRLDLTEQQKKDILYYAVSIIGTEYDYWQLIGLLFNKRGLFDSANKLICSEVIDKAFYYAGVPRKGNLPIGDVTPGELLEIYNLLERGHSVANL
jgi:uncharacterized protein YycO